MILYGHGLKSKPHYVHFRNSFQVVGFLGCDAGSTNRLIPKENRIPGVMMDDHDVKISPHEPFEGREWWWNYQEGQIIRGAWDIARKWLIENPDRCKEVRIIRVKVYSYPGHNLMTMPPEVEDIIINLDNMNEQ